MSYFNNKWVWITGASSGIGKAIAINLAQKNANLILSSRNAKALGEVANDCLQFGVEVIIQKIDLERSDSIKMA